MQNLKKRCNWPRWSKTRFQTESWRLFDLGKQDVWAIVLFATPSSWGKLNIFYNITNENIEGLQRIIFGRKQNDIGWYFRMV